VKKNKTNKNETLNKLPSGYRAGPVTLRGPVNPHGLLGLCGPLGLRGPWSVSRPRAR
jgi:hypothetical protein